MAVSFLGDHSSLMRFMVRDEEGNRQMMEERAASDTSETYDHSRCIMPISQEAADRLRLVIRCIKTAFHVGFLPFLIYLGWRHGPDNGQAPFSITNFFGFY